MFDFAIIGGGIVGASTAWQLSERHPDARLVLIEKEPHAAAHQTGRNSGVIHAGIYYQPGSLKARFCKAGVEATIGFCEQHGIPYEQPGKLVVATDGPELERLRTLFARAKENGLTVSWLDEREFRALEPNVSGIAAILSPASGIVSYGRVAETMIERFAANGGEVMFGAPVTGLAEGSDGVSIATAKGNVRAARLIACGGLQADRLAKMMGLDPGIRIVPYRGEYFRLKADKHDIVKHLIYPVPDPALPFLGVHLTPMIDGSITVGPSALQGWKREGYGRINISARDTWDMLTFPGFWRITARHFSTGLRELRNAVFRSAYLREVQKYCPSLTLDDLEPYPVGVRAMAVGRNGQMIDDFLFLESERSLHVCNAPSPAATSAIPIGEHICERLEGSGKP
ncbi:MAG: L-2-hydroxyglutarate oxidase [Woeseiaceae bacterium]|nr:L-2-hydroxyglutarate oxidase [Woeseiaceae bacterium]